ncbi:MAG: transcription initiation factor IIB [Thermoproteus sp.]|nr:transcription initiation factor IIB [Thermoproteus sp.]
MGEKNQEKLVCPVCGSTDFIYNYERGELVCAVCGTVVSDNLLDLGPEWRAFTSEEKGQRARTGSPVTRLTSEALTTVVGWSDKDAFGRGFDLKRELEVIRLRRWQTRSRVQSGFERNLVQASQELERLRSAMGVPKSCVEYALEIYRIALKEGITKGYPLESVVAAALYMACRILKMPRLLDEISRYTKSTRLEIARCYRLLLKNLNIKVPLNDPVFFVPRIIDQLKLPAEVAKTALNILEDAKKKKITIGKDPASLAVAAVYIAALLHGQTVTQKDMALIAGITEVTLRSRFKEIARALDLRIPLTSSQRPSPS